MFRNRRALKKQMGFTLVEAVVGIAIVGAGMTAVAVMITNLLNSQTILRNYEIAADARGIASAVLSDSDYCTLNFGGAAIPAAVPNRIVAAADLKEVLATGALGANSVLGPGYRNKNLTLTTMELWTTLIIGPNRYMGELRMNFTPDGGGLILNRSIPIFIQRSAAGTLTSCSRVLSAPTDNLASGSYSQDCSDFAAKGWGSKNACLEDGRWHRVYAHDNAGAATFGALADLRNHAAKGAQVKVHLPVPLGGIQFIGANCEDFSMIFGVGVCRTPLLDGVPTWAPGPPAVPATISSHALSQFWFTNGKLVYDKSKPVAPAHGGTVPDAVPAMVGVAMDWYIKY